MINWALPKNLYYLFTLPGLLVLLLIFSIVRRRTLQRVIEPFLLPYLQPPRFRLFSFLKVVFTFLALALFVIALARPRWGERLQMFKGRGVTLVIVVDASKSMLAEDVKPNRLARAKAELASLIDELSGNAVGIVSFAGDAYVLCPLTTDLEAAKLFLDIISPELMPVPGSDFGRAIQVASTLFNPGSATRALVLVTDGEDLGVNTEVAVMEAKEAGIRIYPVAISTPEGAPIPEPGASGVVYKKDKSGNVVISRMDERKLILIAQATGGRFFRLEGFSPVRLAEELQKLEKEVLAGGEFSGYVERYQGFLLAGVILLFLSLFLPERKMALRIPRLRLQGWVILLVLLFGLNTAWADVGGLMRAGNSLYHRQRYEEALSFYQRAEVLEPDNLAIHYNLGNTLYRLGRFPEAVNELSLAMIAKKPAMRARAFYNLGNSFFRMNRLDEAINAYKMALLANPKDQQAKENLEFCLRMKQQQSQKDSTQQQSGGKQDRKSEPSPEPKPSGGGMDKEQAERILQAIENKEKQTQREVRKPKARRQVDKDW